MSAQLRCPAKMSKRRVSDPCIALAGERGAVIGRVIIDNDTFIAPVERCKTADDVRLLVVGDDHD